VLKTRVIPTLLWKSESLVKGIAFNSWRRIGTVLPAIKVYNTRDVDELILVDIEATREKREPDYESIKTFSAECFVPFSVGGGIREVDMIRKLLFVGADKVCINSAAYENPDLIAHSSRYFGSQCIISSIDVRKMPNGTYQCFSHCGSRPTGWNPAAWAKKVQHLGAGEILLTSIERDGTMQGYDLDLLRCVSAQVDIPVIVSGGAGNYEHMRSALKEGGASAVAAASIFHFTEQTPLEAKRYLQEKGIQIRL